MRSKSKYTVKDISVNKQKIIDLLNNAPTYRKRHIIIKQVGGLCSICENIPSKMIIYDVGDSQMKAQRIERYCDKCFEKQVKKWDR